MKFFNTFLLFTPFFAAAQINSQAINKCQETDYKFFRQGQQEQQSSKTYDAKGNLLMQTDVFSSQNTGNYTNEYLYVYDAKGNNIQVTNKQNGQVKSITKKTYNVAGILTNETTATDEKAAPLSLLSSENGEFVKVFYTQDGKTETIREKSTFNSTGQLLKKEVTNPSGKVLMSDTKTYNLQGKITQDIHFDATDKVSTKTDFLYDGNSNLLSDKTFRNEELFAETQSEYDASSKISKKTRLNGKGQIDYYFTYEYDAQGNMSKENYFYNNQKISVRAFEYDTQGNKIKETYFDRTGSVNMYKTWEFACK